MATMKLYQTAAEIEAACVKFFTKGNSLQTEAHKLACSVLRHVGEHGDVRVVQTFLTSFPEMTRMNAVKAWFEAFGPVTFDAKGVKFVQGGKTKLGEAMDAPFWEFTAEPVYQPINPAKALEALIKKLVRDTKETGADHSATIIALRNVPVGKIIVQDAETEEQIVAGVE